MSNENRLYDPQFNPDYCGFCHSEPCTCGGLHEQNRIRDEDNLAQWSKELEQRDMEKISYHNDELCEREEWEKEHCHELDEIEVAPSVRAPRTLRSMVSRTNPRR